MSESKDTLAKFMSWVVLGFAAIGFAVTVFAIVEALT